MVQLVNIPSQWLKVLKHLDWRASLEDGEASPTLFARALIILVLTAEPEILGAHGYFWILEWSVIRLLPLFPTTTIEIDEDAPPGNYDICVKAFKRMRYIRHGIWFPVEIYEIPPEEKAPATFCDEDFSNSWGAMNINGPGDYEQSYEDTDVAYLIVPGLLKHTLF
jgi:hypothetical protein